MDIIKTTIEYLSAITGVEYAQDSKPTINALNQLIREGYGFEDFKLVINKKWKQWKNTEFQKFVRPSTLFGTNFKKYLNEQPRNNSPFERLANAVNQAKQTNWKLDSK